MHLLYTVKINLFHTDQQAGSLNMVKQHVESTWLYK